MIDINEAKVGLLVAVEDKCFLIPGVIMVVDLDRRQVGVKKVFSRDTEIFPVEKVYFCYPLSNGHQPVFSPPPPPPLKDRILLRLLGGFIITLSKGETRPETTKEVADEVIKAGIANEGARAQEIIAALH